MSISWTGGRESRLLNRAARAVGAVLFAGSAAIPYFASHDMLVIASIPFIVLTAALPPFLFNKFISSVGVTTLLTVIFLGGVLVPSQTGWVFSFYTVVAVFLGALLAYYQHNNSRRLFYFNKLILLEKMKSEGLVSAMLPEAVARQLMAQPEEIVAHTSDNATVTFVDLVGFEDWASRLEPHEVVAALNVIFARLDDTARTNEVERIKTVGDSYVAMTGLPLANRHHADRAFVFAKLALYELGDLFEEKGWDLSARVGIASGSVRAGVIGSDRYAYDIWGPTVKHAALLEKAAEPGAILMCEDTYRLLGEDIPTSQSIDSVEGRRAVVVQVLHTEYEQSA